jgi:putative spermidine/putrescine transport system permease protein
MRFRHWLGAWGPALPLLGLVSMCLLAPLVFVVLQTIATPGGVGLENWARVLGQAGNQRAVATSVSVGLTCAVISTAVGTPIAWLITRMLPGRRATWLGLFNVAAHFGGIGLAFAFVATLGALGMVTLLLQGLGIPFSPPERESGAALVMVYEYAGVPLFVLLTIPAMGILREEWQEAAEMASATRLQFWRRVGLPVLMPFIAAGFVLSFTWVIGNYSIAYGLLGGSAASPTRLLTLEIGSALSDDVLNGPTRAAVLCVLLIAIALIALAVYRVLLRRGMRWFTTGQIGANETMVAGFRSGIGTDWLRPRRRSAFANRALFVLLLAYLSVPVVAVVLYSLATRWSAHVLPDGYTFDWWAAVLRDERIRSAFGASLALGGLTALIDMLIVVPAVYWARIRNPRMRPVLDMTAAIPVALPFLVVAFALLEFTGAAAPSLQGTFLLLLLGSATVCFPYVYWAVDGAMSAAGIDRITEAAETCGASPLQVLRHVVLPNIRSGLATGGLLCFATAMGDFAMVQILASSVRTLPIWSAEAIRDTSRHGGAFSELAVVTTITFGLLLVTSVAVVRGRFGRTPAVAIGMPAIERVARS